MDSVTPICVVCQQALPDPGKRRPRKYCSPLCASRSAQRNRKAIYTHKCVMCDEEFTSYRKDRVTCSRACGAKVGNMGRPPRPPRPTKPKPARACVRCGREHTLSTKYCSANCRDAAASARAAASWSPLRRAVEAGDYTEVLRLIRTDVVVDENECWNWQRQLRNGYAVVGFGRKRVQVYRLALESKLQAPLGRQTAHHICANPACVNPYHLQSVTNRENVAEMLARTDYVNRIEELEEALRRVAPGHPLLYEAPLGGVRVA